MKKLALSVTTILFSLSITSATLASNLIPSYGMSCSTEEGYTLDIYPQGKDLLEFNMLSPEGYLVDDNVHSFDSVMDQSIHEVVLNSDDGVVSFEILGLQEESVSGAYVQYNNDVLSLRLHFNNCDII